MSKSKGFKEAAGRMNLRAEILRGRRGSLYVPNLSGDMRDAIDNNADSSYNGSPAKDRALNSVTNWTHGNIRHILPIMSLLYANYRQYGCGGLKIAILVQVFSRDKEKMRKHFAEVLHNPR